MAKTTTTPQSINEGYVPIGNGQAVIYQKIQIEGDFRETQATIVNLSDIPPDMVEAELDGIKE